MITKGFEKLCKDAEEIIDTIDVNKALSMYEDSNIQFVDIRDVRELWREGGIPNAVHAPRGMLEAWVDPSSPYAKDIFQSGKHFVFFCAGGLRSALATRSMFEMGLTNVCHIRGGFGAWKKAGGAVERVEPKIPKVEPQ